jgi:predicted MFS family arabinose efflux permease
MRNESLGGTARPSSGSDAHTPSDGGTRTAAEVGAPVIPRLWTRPFVTLCAVALLVYGAQMLLQPILPILVLRQGGDAALVGLVIAAFSLPSVVLRPFMGRAVDAWSLHGTMTLGALFLGVANLIYLVPNLIVVFLDRVLHGTAWAAYNTAGHSMVARLAPPARRAEASGMYNLMPGIAQMVMPGLGLLLLGVTDLAGPFLLAAALSFGAAALVILGALPRPAGVAQAGQDGGWRRLIEHSAVLPMTLELLFTSVSALFLAFPPVWAEGRGIPVESLAVYYPICGATLVVTRLIAGRYLDRFERRMVIAAGGALAIAGLLIATVAADVAVLTLGGATYAAAAAFTSPTIMALAIDRADPRRMGAAMATYSLGFQLGLGVGAVAWGLVIQLFGYPAPFVAAIAVQGLLIAAVRRGVRGGSP